MSMCKEVLIEILNSDTETILTYSINSIKSMHHRMKEELNDMCSFRRREPLMAPIRRQNPDPCLSKKNRQRQHCEVER